MPFVSLESSETYEDRIKSFGLTRKKYDINFRYFSISPCKDYTLVPPVLQCLDPFFINTFIQVCKKRVRRCDDFGIGFKIVPSKKFFEVWKEAEVRRDQVGWIGWARYDFKLQFMNFNHLPDSLAVGSVVSMKRNSLLR